MKKTLSFMLTAALTASLLAGCGGKTTTTTTPATPATPSGGNTTTAPASSSGITKVGLGHITSIASSKSLGVDASNKEVLPLGQVDTVIAAVAFDKDGKVVKLTLDDAQTKVEFNKDLTLKSDVKADGKTKVELGDAYGMGKSSAIKKEWYQQADALGKWMVGKTVADIKAMKTVKKDDAHPAVPDVAELKSSVTISVQEFIEAVDEAYKNAVDVKGVEKIGLGHEVSIASSKGLGKDANGKEVLPLAQVDDVLTLGAFDKDGKVVKAIIDTAQTKINFDNTGKITSDLKAEPKTKVELKEGYGMGKTSAIKKEWYQQAEALGKWMEGKTIADIKAMKTAKKDDAHPAVPDVAELKSSVTISVQEFIAAIAEASQNAK